MPTPADLPTLVRGINSKRPFDAFFALCLSGFGAAAIWTLVRYGVSGPATVLAIVGIGGALLQLRTVLRPSRAHPGIRALVERPDQIVWWYVLHSGPRRTLRLRLEDGQIADIPLRYRLPLIGPDDVPAAAEEVGPILRHATAGYSHAHREAYDRDPASLRRR